MLKEWQFNVLFFVGVGGAVFLLVGPSIGLTVSKNPETIGGVGVILSYVLTQKRALTKNDKKDEKKEEGDDTE